MKWATIQQLKPKIAGRQFQAILYAGWFFSWLLVTVSYLTDRVNAVLYYGAVVSAVMFSAALFFDPKAGWEGIADRFKRSRRGHGKADRTSLDRLGAAAQSVVRYRKTNRITSDECKGCLYCRGTCQHPGGYVKTTFGNLRLDACSNWFNLNEATYIVSAVEQAKMNLGIHDTQGL